MMLNRRTFSAQCNLKNVFQCRLLLFSFSPMLFPNHLWSTLYQVWYIHCSALVQYLLVCPIISLDSNSLWLEYSRIFGWIFFSLCESAQPETILISICWKIPWFNCQVGHWLSNHSKRDWLLLTPVEASLSKNLKVVVCDGGKCKRWNRN